MAVDVTPNLHENGRRQRPTQPNVALATQESAWATALVTVAAERPARTSIGIQLEQNGVAAVVMVAGGSMTPTAALGYKLDAINGPLFWSTDNLGVVQAFKVSGTPVINIMDNYTSGDGGEAA